MPLTGCCCCCLCFAAGSRWHWLSSRHLSPLSCEQIGALNAARSRRVHTCHSTTFHTGGAPFGPDICNSAREGSDISPSWERILYELDTGSKYADMAGPGFHNDFDMLEVSVELHSPESIELRLMNTGGQRQSLAGRGTGSLCALVHAQ